MITSGLLGKQTKQQTKKNAYWKLETITPYLN